MNSILVKTEWDSDAQVWTATSSDVTGLVAESPSLEKLRPKVLAMIGDLVEEGAVSFQSEEIVVHIFATVHDSIKISVAA